MCPTAKLNSCQSALYTSYATNRKLFSVNFLIKEKVLYYQALTNIVRYLSCSQCMDGRYISGTGTL